jgi:uroporphyrinogen decarboxylase
MNKREAYIDVIKRRANRPVPYFFRLCSSLEDAFKSKYGNVDYRDYYEIPIKEVFIKPTRLNTYEVFSKYVNELPGDYTINEWGIGLKKGSVGHFYSMKGPLINASSVKDIEELPFPDFLEEYRWEGVRQKIDELKQRGFITMCGIYGDADIGGNEFTVPAFMDIFESSWYLRGLENMLADFYTNQDMAQALLDRMTDFKEKLALKWVKAGIDILVYADDVGTQNTLMMSKETYSRWIEPRLKRIISAAKEINPDVMIFYHSDGNIEEIIPNLIECGVEILNPIQPECMNPVEISKKYALKLSFWGTVGTQTTLPFDTPKEVRGKCREMIEKVGADGGLILAPTHLVEPEVPFENIEAFISEVKKHGI